MSDDLKNKYYPRKRFQVPALANQAQFENPYDIPSDLLQDLIQRKLQPYKVTTIDLSVAGTLELNVPGYAIVQYGFETSQASVRTVDTTSFMQMFLEENVPGDASTGIPSETGFPLKHSRGYRGPFTKVFLWWPAQNDVSCDIVVHRYMDMPWVNGESAT